MSSFRTPCRGTAEMRHPQPVENVLHGPPNDRRIGIALKQVALDHPLDEGSAPGRHHRIELGDGRMDPVDERIERLARVARPTARQAVVRDDVEQHRRNAP